ncbi:MAG: O-antigen ligase family protein [Clostridia bacterium]|nr:O-antigen ligase family protein [Clostridia bacterium]
MLAKREPLKLNLIELLIIVAFAYSIAPIVSRFISSYLTTYFYMLVVVALVALVMLIKGARSLNDCIVLLVPFLLWKLLTFLLPRGNIILWGYQAVLDLMPVVLGYYFLNHAKSEKFEFFAKIIFWLCLITCVTTIIGCMEFPDASRYLATVDNPDAAKAVLYNWRNIGGYEFVYMVVLIHPLVVLAQKTGKLKKIYAFLCTALVFALSIFSGYTTALLLTLLTTFTYFLNKKLTPKQLIVWVVCVIVITVTFFTLFSDLLMWFADVIDNKFISERLRSLAGGREGIEGSDDNRIALYERAINTFINSPILGSYWGGGHNSGHSFILDFTAQFGIIGLSVLIFAYYVIYRYFLAPYKNKEGFGFVVWLFVQTILLSLVNTGMWLIVLTVIIPIFLKVIYKGDENSENTVDS